MHDAPRRLGVLTVACRQDPPCKRLSAITNVRMSVIIPIRLQIADFESGWRILLLRYPTPT